jgi:ATP-dependent DNA helicase RecG
VHQAVREALVNTLVHADYQGRSGVRLIRARSSFEFINPGLLLVSPEQVWRGGVSEPRNPALQKLFGLLQLGEREGSGGPKLRHVWQQQHWRLPHLGQDTEDSETHLVLRQESLLPEPVVEALVSRLHDGFTNQDEVGRSILVTAEAEGSITHARARLSAATSPFASTTYRRCSLEDSLSADTRKIQTTPSKPTAPPARAHEAIRWGVRVDRMRPFKVTRPIA